MASVALSVDPGLSIGYAVWPWPNFYTSKEPPLHIGSISPQRVVWGTDWEVQVRSALHRFEEHVLCWPNIARVWLESPVFYDTPGGRACAVKGDLTKLTLTLGWLLCFFDHLGVQWELAPVPIWKGQLPKKVVERRIKKVLGRDWCRQQTRFSSHAWDAIGIGLWAKGLL